MINDLLSQHGIINPDNEKEKNYVSLTGDAKSVRSKANSILYTRARKLSD